MASKAIKYGALAGVALGVGLMFGGTKKRRRRKSVKTGVKIIQFGEGDGESIIQLPKGGEFIVRYDELSPWAHTWQATETTPMVGVKDGKLRFRLTKTLPPGSPDQVYVQALDENDTVMGEHKITIFAPA